MKINEDFLLKEMKDAQGATTYYAIAVGKTAAKFKGMVKLNETAAFIWKKIAEGLTEDEILKAVVQTYDVAEETAKADLEKIISELKGISAIED